jgi:hypothetical protein
MEIRPKGEMKCDGGTNMPWQPVFLRSHHEPRKSHISLRQALLLAMLQVGSIDIKGSDTLKAIRIPWGISSAP